MSRLAGPRRTEPAPCPVSVAGQPVLGSTLHPDGLELQLTLLNATTMQPLSDAHKPARTRNEGLLAEMKGGKKVRLELPLTVRLTGSCHTFKFFVLLLSSDISGALMKIKVAPPNADADHPLCVITRAFKSRARSNLHEVGSKRPRSPLNNSDVDTNLNLNDVSTDSNLTGGGDGGGGSEATEVVAAAAGDAALADDTNHGLPTDSNLGRSVDLNLVSNFASGIDTLIVLDDNVDTDVDTDLDLNANELDDDVDTDDVDTDDVDTDLDLNANDLDEFFAAP